MKGQTHPQFWFQRTIAFSYPPTSLRTSSNIESCSLTVSFDLCSAFPKSPLLHVRQFARQQESCLCQELLAPGLSPPSGTLSGCLSMWEAGAESPAAE